MDLRFLAMAESWREGSRWFLEIWVTRVGVSGGRGMGCLGALLQRKKIKGYEETE